MSVGELYLDWLLASTSPHFTSWLGEEALRAHLRADLERTLAERMDSVPNAAAYARLCPVRGASPEEYRLREIRPAPDLSVLAGVHFQALDVRRPFVGVYAQSRYLRVGELPQVSRRLVDEFRIFRPPRVWWWAATEDPVLAETSTATPDQRVLAGRLTDIQSPVGCTTDPAIRIDGDWQEPSYESYVRFFEAYLRERPEWRGNLQRTERDELEACARHGGLGRILHEDREVGFLAAMPGTVRGVPGWVMYEQILASELRGRGLAARIQAAFLARLDPAVEPLILGTVDARNRPSLATALRVGRRDVGGWIFVAV